MDLREKARKLPERPGVYIMQDGYANIIYIGKAKNLKNRVSQYFQSSNRHTPKIIRMIENIEDFEYITVDTELEALLLECRLIKDMKPMYNSQLKNDLGYCYVRLTEDKFPVFELLGKKAESGICFGPYASEKSVERALAVLQDNFKLRHCKSLVNRKSGCLRQQLGICLAPCTEGDGVKEYSEQVEGAVAFLEGRNCGLIKLLQSKMEAAAEALDFNKAAKLRDDLRALKRMVGRQKAIGFAQQNRSIVVIEKLNDSTAKFFLLQGSHIIYKEKLELEMQAGEKLSQHIKILILKYLKNCDSGILIPDKQEVDQAHIIYSYLKNKKDCSYMIIPKSWLTADNVIKLELNIDKLMKAIFE